MDNVFIERLWRSLKYECVYLSEFTTGSEARTGIGGWMDFYNRCRPHSSLNGRTPEEAYTSDEADRSLGHPPQLRLPRRAGNQRGRRALESHAQGASDLRPGLSQPRRRARRRRCVRRTLQPVLAPRKAGVSHATRSARAIRATPCRVAQTCVQETGCGTLSVHCCCSQRRGRFAVSHRPMAPIYHRHEWRRLRLSAKAAEVNYRDCQSRYGPFLSRGQVRCARQRPLCRR